MKNKEENKKDFTKLRHKMVVSQIIVRGIFSPKVVAALKKVPRHIFVPEELRECAYEDRPLPIGEGQTISQPYIVAYMTQILKLSGKERILEIGTGCGYQTAILAEIATKLYSIEIVESLAQKASKCLEQLQYKNIRLKCADGYQGWSEKAPFDAIIVACAPERIPKPLQEQLAIGGKMIIPVGPVAGEQHLVFLEKIAPDQIKRTNVLAVRFVPMTGIIQND